MQDLGQKEIDPLGTFMHSLPTFEDRDTQKKTQGLSRQLRSSIDWVGTDLLTPLP